MKEREVYTVPSRKKKRRQKIPISTEEKRAFLANAFFYEIKMLKVSLEKVNELNEKEEKDKENRLLRNVATEIFAVHAKNIMEFLCFPPNQSYMRAYEFVDDPQNWKSDANSKKCSLISVHQQVCEEITHLTRKRIPGNKSNEPFKCGPISQTISQYVLSFLRAIRREYQTDELDEIKRICLDIVHSQDEGITVTTVFFEYTLRLSF